ncbi:class F sortase [Streptomyces sp. NPDC000410]|uniref:class F sortase n=1 Tax=Streptomyces sp. NPDC000410 TaxID=3154254 RepID=UPI00331C2FE3
MNFRQPSDQPSPRSTARSIRKALMWPLAAAGVGALLIYTSVDTTGESRHSARPAAVPTQRAAGPSGAVPVPPKAAVPAKPAPPLPRSAPNRISIPKILVDAPFTTLKIAPAGNLEAPPKDDNNLVGWWKDGPAPGERGTSIVTGHFDTMTGPAVFVDLSTLKPGDPVHITRQDGVVATFKVDSVETFSKANFPNARVYNDTAAAQLRLITCAGMYNKVTKDYNENLVVFAHLASSRRAA